MYGLPCLLMEYIFIKPKHDLSRTYFIATIIYQLLPTYQGEVRLPSRDVMWSDIRHKRDIMRERYVNSTRHTLQGDYITVMDETGFEAGCKPHIG